jgi:hypothetical protein
MKLLAPLLALWACLFSGCMTARSGYSYSMIMVNTGQEKMHALNIRSLDTDWEFFGPYSILSPFAESVHTGPIPAPPNGRFVYSWRDAKGGEHREEIDMEGKVSRQFKGEIVFIVDGDNKLTVETYNKRYTYQLQRKPQQ